jgi:hypothetical protein
MMKNKSRHVEVIRRLTFLTGSIRLHWRKFPWKTSDGPPRVLIWIVPSKPTERCRFFGVSQLIDSLLHLSINSLRRQKCLPLLETGCFGFLMAARMRNPRGHDLSCPYAKEAVRDVSLLAIGFLT